MTKTTKTKKSTTSSLLIDDKPMMALPKLLHRLGSDRALILQQLHYWVNLFEDAGNKRMYRDGCWWVFNTIEEWQFKQFTWLTAKVVGNILRELEKMGLITSKKFYSYKWDQKKWYSLNYDAIAELAVMDVAFVNQPIKELVELIAKSLKPLENSNVSQETINSSSQGISNMLCGDNDLRDYNKETNSKETKGNIDTFSSRKSDSTFELTGNLSNKGGNKTIGSTASGTASPGNNPDSCGASENENHSQNEKIEPPVKRWNLDVPIAVDSEGYIKFPPMKNVDPVIKPKFAQVLRKVYRETQFHVVEEWIDSDNISIDEDEDGEIVICDKNGDWTEEEAFGQGGCLPLRLLRNIAATDEYSGFSADAYNQFIVDRFNYHWNRR